MPLPGDLHMVTVTGTILCPDGSNASGTVTFQMPYNLRDTTGHVVVGNTPPTVATLVNGAFSAQLPATDQSQVNPINWAYTISVNTDAGSFTFLAQLPSSPASTTLDALIPLVTPPTPGVYVPLTYIAAANGVASLDGTGHVPLSQLPSGSGVLTVTAGDSTITIGGTSQNPTVAVNAIAESKVTGLVTDLAAKAADNVVVHLAGAETITGAKTFGTAPTVPTPVNPTDASTKAYVDSVAQGLVVKTSVTAATSSNLTLSGTQTIDGVAVTAGQRVLLTGQTTASQNGIWTVTSGAWTRPSDFASGSTQVGAFTFVEAGTVNGQSGWVLAGATAVTVDTTAQTWTQFSGAGEITAGTYLTKSGNTISAVAGTTSGTVAAGNDSRIVNAVQNTVVTTKGDLLAATGNAALSRLGVGSDGQVLTAASGQPTGIRWASPATPPQLYIPQGYGLTAITGDPLAYQNPQGAGNNFIWYTRLPVPASGSFTNLWVACGAAGTWDGATTPNQIGAYDDNGQLLSSTPNNNSLWGAVGWSGGAMSGGAQTPSTSYFYILALIHGVTGVSLCFPATPADAHTFASRGPGQTHRRCGYVNGATALPPTFDPTSYGTESGFGILAGAS